MVPCTTDPRKLQCKLCGNEFATKSDTVEGHLKSQRHSDGLRKEEEKAKSQPKIEDLPKIREEKKEEAVRRERDIVASAHRRRVLVMCMQHGISPECLHSDLKELLEEERPFRIALGHQTDLVRAHLPTLIDEHMRGLRTTLTGKLVAYFADASPRFDEAFVVGVRWCEANFVIRQEVVDFRLFQEPLTGKDYSCLVLSGLESVGIGRDSVIAGLTDRAATNGVLAQTLASTMPRYLHSFCMAHAMDSLLKKFACPVLKNFLLAWNKTFGKSSSARYVFKRVTQENFVRTHQIRWGATYDQVVQVSRIYGKLQQIVDEMASSGYALKGVVKLKAATHGYLSNESDLALELATFRDAGRHFRELNLLFQGDGFLSPFVYGKIMDVNATFNSIQSGRAAQNLPSVAAVIAAATRLSKENMWVDAKKILNPAWVELNGLFNKGELRGEAKVSFLPMMKLFRFAQLFHPRFCQLWINRVERPLSLDEELANTDLRRVLGAGLCDRLKTEFASLAVLYADFTEATNLNPAELLTFWSEKSSTVPAWAEAARVFVLLQPSSAAAERAFSVWRTRVSELQTTMLEDRQKLTMQLNCSTTISPERRK